VSVGFAGNTTTLPDLPLTVNSSDGAGCVLSVTQLDADGDTFTTAAPITLGPAPGFAPTASFFTGTLGDAFYANANIAPLDFSTPVLITVEFSDVPDAVMPVVITSTTSSAAQSTIPSPGYTAVSTVAIAQNAGLVTGQSGNVTFTLPAGATAGESYVIVNGPTSPQTSFTSDDFAFNNAGSKGISAVTAIPISPPPFTIDATVLVPNDTPVPSSALIIIQHVDNTTHDKTYETVEYDFAGNQ
jgi:hypothetical protein